MQTRAKRANSNPPGKEGKATNGAFSVSSSQLVNLNDAPSRSEKVSSSQPIIAEETEMEARISLTPTNFSQQAKAAGDTGVSNSLLSGGSPLNASGLSGSSLSRQQEKDELRMLNNRFAAYIDTIRNQEEEILQLRRKVDSINATESKEAKALSDTYGREIDNLRRVLDEVSKNCAAATAERDDSRREFSEYAARNEALEKERQTLQRKLKDSDAALKDLRMQLSATKEQMKDHNDQITTANGKVRELQTQVDQLKAELLSETVKSVDAENRLMSVREELRFQKNLHDEQVSALRNQRTVEVSEVEARLQDDYHTKISDHINNLRAEMQAIADEAQEELERNYEQRIEDLQNLATHNSQDYRQALEELKSTQARIKEFQTHDDRQNKEYRGMIARLEADSRAKDVDNAKLQQLLRDRQFELQKIHKELSELKQMYQDLYGEKIELDAELATYNTLLKTEEARLHLNSPVYPSSPDSGRRGFKRRAGSDHSITRTQFRNEATAKGDVHVVEIDPEGKFVRLENKSSEDSVIGGWYLRMRADNDKEKDTRYKIPQNRTIKAFSTITIWSANTNIAHDSASDIEMEVQWVIGESTLVTLFNPEGEEVARREMLRSAVSQVDSPLFNGSQGAKRRRHIPQTNGLTTEEHEKNCAIM